MSVEIEEIRDFLGEYEPFRHLDHDELDRLSFCWKIKYVRRGEPLLTVGKPNDHLHVLRTGAIDVLDANGFLLDRRDVGQSFGHSTLLGQRESQYEVIAVEDCLILTLDREFFQQLVDEYPEVKRYYAGVSERVRSANTEQQQNSPESAVLRTKLGQFAIADPANTASSTTVQDAAKLMNELRVSSLLIIDNDRLVGIITDRDMRKVVANNTPVSTTVGEIMPKKLITRNSDTVVIEAMVLMAERDIHHLPVVDEGKVTGIVTAADIMRLLKHDPIYVTGELSTAETPEDMAPVYAAAQEMAVQYVERGVAAQEVQALLTVAADALARRLLTLAEEKLGPPPVPYAFVVLGSQGRREMGFASDQDNALVLADDYDEAQHGEYFAKLAEFVCDGLATAGQPLCPGNMMATNPKWRMRVSEWQKSFHYWITAPEPDALLWAMTFFDMRGIYGEVELAESVHAQAVESAYGATRLHAHLAALAARWEPPLGIFRGLAVDRKGKYANTLNVKKGGVAACVQIARLVSIEANKVVLPTRTRLAQSAGVSFPRRNAMDLRDAFDFLNAVSLRNQAKQFRNGEELSYQIKPSRLGKMERENLRDAFQILKTIQNGMTVRYPIRNI